jgi:hypothetical protein
MEEEKRTRAKASSDRRGMRRTPRQDLLRGGRVERMVSSGMERGEWVAAGWGMRVSFRRR